MARGVSGGSGHFPHFFPKSVPIFSGKDLPRASPFFLLPLCQPLVISGGQVLFLTSFSASLYNQYLELQKNVDVKLSDEEAQKLQEEMGDLGI